MYNILYLQNGENLIWLKLFPNLNKYVNGKKSAGLAPMIAKHWMNYYNRSTSGCFKFIEIHEALVLDDHDEFMDAIGDTIITLINIADIKGVNAEDCLEQAFNVIKLRKGLVSDAGDFVRYAKLSEEDEAICDKKQGNPGNQYFDESMLDKLSPENFRR